MLRYQLISILLLVTLNTLSGKDGRLALVIGNGKYQNCELLLNPENDAQAMADILEMLGYEVILHKNLDLRDMKLAIDNYGERLRDFGSGLFFYAGHGIQVNGSNYLIPVDASISYENDVEYNCVRAERILSRMEAANNKTNIIILDACRDNPFEKGWTRSTRGDGLAFMEAPSGSLIAYATSPGNTASDGLGANGLYTSVLLNYIGDPDLNVIQVFQNVRKMVRLKSGGSQVPWESTSLEGDFYFNQIGEKKIILSEVDLPYPGSDLGRKEDNNEINRIKSSDSYLWAEHESDLLIEADEFAKLLLINVISRYLSDKFIEPDNVHKWDDDLYIQDIIPFSSRMVYHRKEKISVIRYIPVDNISSFVEQKERRILTLYYDAQLAESTGKVGDALKYYYWCYVLLSYHPIKLVFDGERSLDNEDNHVEYLKNRTLRKINDIISNIKCGITNSMDDGGIKKYTIQFSYDGIPIDQLSIRYWDGISWSKQNDINNGVGIINIRSSQSMDTLRIKINYQNLHKARYDRDLFNALQQIRDPNIQDIIEFNIPDGDLLSERDDQLKMMSDDNDRDKSEYIDLIKRTIDKVQSTDNQYDESLFTTAGYEVFSKLLYYGNATFLEDETEYKYAAYKNDILVRGLPVKFRFHNNSVEFTEKLCFTIDSAKRIDNITFTLRDNSINDILSHSRWSEKDKWQIIRFLEDYKTAYALKRIDYINSIFSDNALIIVGRRVQRSAVDANIRLNINADNFELIKLSKEQYMYRLKRVFEKNEFINILFEDNVIKKRDPDSNVYGINIRQNYYSSNYADQGYLFLLVNIKKDQDAEIYVRAWQPKRFEDGSVINLSSFTY